MLTQTSGVIKPAVGSPRLIGVVWALLLVNTLGFTGVHLIVPLPRSIFQAVAMGSLVVAFGLALVLNPRIRVQPSAYLLLLSLLVVASIASSIRLESGLGALYRCFRFTLFVTTLWLVSGWWRGDLRFARYHLYALSGVLFTVLAGLAISPGSAFSGPDGRLAGAIWPIPSTQVGQYCAIATGLAVILWLTKNIDGRSASFIIVPAVGLLLLSHTRTALIGLIAALVVTASSLALTNARSRRALATAAGFAAAIAAAFSQVVVDWLQRGQDSQEITDLTGRATVWSSLLAMKRTASEQVFGVGLTDKSFGGLPIDSSWMAIYHEQGWVGITLVVAILGGLIGTAVLRPPSPRRACAVFLIFYCITASYTEVGLGDASPYLLHLAVAAALLIPGDTRTGQDVALPQGNPI